MGNIILYPFLFVIYLNDLEKFFIDKNITGLSVIGQELEDKLFIYLKIFKTRMLGYWAKLLLQRDDKLSKVLYNFINLTRKITSLDDVL